MFFSFGFCVRMHITVYVQLFVFGWLHVYLSRYLCYLNMSIKGQHGTSDGTVQRNGSVCVCVCVGSIEAARIAGRNKI